MWRRGEVGRPPTGGRDESGAAAPAPPGAPSGLRTHAPESEVMRHMDKGLEFGKSVVFKGELSGSEDLVIEGTVEGKIELREHVLTIGPHAKIRADVFAKVVIVRGEVVGNITAGDKLDIRDSGSVDGNIVTPIITIAEGAQLRGSIEMQKKPAAAAQTAAAPRPDVKPAPVPPGSLPPGSRLPGGPPPGSPPPGSPRPAGA